jgi:excisionase family DNA binding protein
MHIDDTLCENLHDVNRKPKGVSMQSQQTPTPLLVSKKEASVLLGVCPRTIDNFVARKELPCRRIGRRTLIPYKSLLLFAKRDHVTGTADAQ